MNVEVTGAQALITGISRIAMALSPTLQVAMKKAVLNLERRAKRLVYEGPLHKDLGHYAASITHEIEPGGMKSTVGPTVIYAPIQEYGGTIVPKKAKVLAWPVRDLVQSTRVVKGVSHVVTTRVRAKKVGQLYAFAKKVTIKPKHVIQTVHDRTKVETAGFFNSNLEGLIH